MVEFLDWALPEDPPSGPVGECRLVQFSDVKANMSFLLQAKLDLTTPSQWAPPSDCPPTRFRICTNGFLTQAKR